MKKIFSLVIMVIMITVFTSTDAFACITKNNIQVTVNGKAVKYDAKLYMQGGDVMLPVKQTSEALGAKVEIDSKNKTVWVNMGMMHAELPIGKREFYIHRDADFTGIPQTIKLDTPIKSIRGTVFISGKKFFESLGAVVTWDSKRRVLSIVTDKSTGNDLSQTIPYTEITKEDIIGIRDVYRWYNDNYKKSGIHYIKKDSVMYVLIGAGRKPTGGYTVGIGKIAYETREKAYISAYVKRPTPDMMVTQAETFPSMLIKITGCKELRSISGEVQEMIVDTVPTKAAYEEITIDEIKNNASLINWYNQNYKKQGISYISDNNYMYVLVGAGEKPTGGYIVNIDNVYYSSFDIVTVNARVTPPGDNVRVMMMITYPSTLIRIKSNTIKTVVGEVVDNTKAPGKEKWITMDSNTVTKMELYNLYQGKLRDITGTEKNDIMKSFNEAILDPNPHIDMIIGSVLEVTMKDGYVVTFTSYGSDTNVIASLTKDGETRTFHLIAPVIAKILLAK